MGVPGFADVYTLTLFSRRKLKLDVMPIFGSKFITAKSGSQISLF